MKASILLVSLAIASLGLPTSSQADKAPQLVHMEPLPFPAAPPDAPVMSIQAIESEIEDLNRTVGGFPPRLRGEEERQSTYERWSKAVRAAETLEQTQGRSERLASALTALYRQGHNMEVMECGLRANAAIERGLSAYPDSIPLNWQASYFYLQIDPRHAPKGEKALLNLRRLLGTDENLEVERGLVFAYLLQGKETEARKQIDRCLALSPDDDMLLKFKQALKDGKIKMKHSD